MKYENQIHFILIDRGFPAGIMCHAESRLFHGPETGYRRASLEPAGNPDTSRRQDFHTGQQQRPLINEPFQPSDSHLRPRADIARKIHEPPVGKPQIIVHAEQTMPPK